MNGCFQEVCMRESDFNEQAGSDENLDHLEELQVTVQEVRDTMEALGMRKSVKPEGVSYCVLSECSKQLAEKIHCVIVSLLAEGKAPADWKKTDIIQLYKGRN